MKNNWTAIIKVKFIQCVTMERFCVILMKVKNRDHRIIFGLLESIILKRVMQKSRVSVYIE